MDKTFDTVLLPIAYLPPVSWFYYYLNSASVEIEQYETYPKQTYRNRSTILSANGKLDLSIPVSKPNGKHTITCDVDIFNLEKWSQNHWKAICSAYLNSPFFEYYTDEVESVYKSAPDKLVDFNLKMLEVTLDILGIKSRHELTNDFVHYPANTLDLRNEINPKKESKNLVFPDYIQVFSSRFGFTQNLSIIDVIFNLGPESLDYLKQIKALA